MIDSTTVLNFPLAVSGKAKGERKKGEKKRS